MNTDVQKLSLLIVSLQFEAVEISHHNFEAKNITIVSKLVEDSPDKVKEAETSARMRGIMGERTSSLNRLRFASLWNPSRFQFLLSGLSLFSVIEVQFVFLHEASLFLANKRQF